MVPHDKLFSCQVVFAGKYETFILKQRAYNFTIRTEKLGRRIFQCVTMAYVQKDFEKVTFLNSIFKDTLNLSLYLQ